MLLSVSGVLQCARNVGMNSDRNRVAGALDSSTSGDPPSSIYGIFVLMFSWPRCSPPSPKVCSTDPLTLMWAPYTFLARARCCPLPLGSSDV